MRLLRGALATLAVLALAIGCGGGGEAAETTFEPGSNLPPPGRAAEEREDEPAPPAEEDETVAPSHCPEGVSGCRTTEGRIVYVEAIDPDGDGDAHFVITDSQSITLPGLTAIDVRKGLRPHPLPGPGDLVSAAGPVQTGSYGQEQIHALELHVGE